MEIACLAKLVVGFAVVLIYQFVSAALLAIFLTRRKDALLALPIVSTAIPLAAHPVIKVVSSTLALSAF